MSRPISPLFPNLHKYAGRPLELSTYVPSANVSVAQNTIADQLMVVHERTVPKGVVWSPAPRGKGVIQIGFAEDITPTGDQGAEAVTYPIARIVGRNDENIGDGLAQYVALKSAGTKRGISAVQDHVDNPSAGTITCTDETAAVHRYAYNPFATGLVVVRVVVSGTQGDIGFTILETDIRTLHASNQERRGNNPIMWGCHLPPGFKIQTLLSAPWVAAWKAGNTLLDVNLDFARVIHSVIERPLRAFASPKEPVLGYTVARQAQAYASALTTP